MGATRIQTQRRAPADRHRLIRVAATGFALIMAGCGGGNSVSGSKAEFIARADARCKATSDRAKGMLGLAAVDPAQAVTDLLPSFEALVADLHALAAPADDQELKGVMTEFDKALEQFRTVARARAAHDEVTVQRTLTQMRVEEDAFERQTRHYGFKECGRS